MNDELRSLLGDLDLSPPEREGRAGQVRARGRALRRRRRMVAAGTGTAFAVAAALLIRPVASPSSLVVDPSGTPSAVPSESSSESASAEPSQSASASPSAAASGSSAPSQAGTASRFTVALTLDRTAVTTSEFVTAKAHVSGQGPAYVTFDYGDGSRISQTYTCTTLPSDVPARRHAYRHPGAHHITVTVQHANCHPPGIDAPDAAPAPVPGEPPGTATATVSVTGPVRANGPERPVAFLAGQYDNENGFRNYYACEDLQHLGDVCFAYRAGDMDGWVSRWVIDLGDGSAPMVHDTGHCVDPGTHWPESWYGWNPYPQNYPQYRGDDHFRYKYATPGSYTATITVTSGGCNGSDVQTATDSVTVNTAGPSPSPSSSPTPSPSDSPTPSESPTP